MGLLAGTTVPESPRGGSWSHDLQSYEKSKRWAVSPGHFQQPNAGLTTKAILRAERQYDPIVQRFRDPVQERIPQEFERQERLKQVNAAKDRQLSREQPYDLINFASRTIPAEQTPPMHNMQPAMPSTAQEYNIVSNLPFSTHHWNASDRRPYCAARLEPTPRKVLAGNIKDFNIVTNRYLFQHEGKEERDRAVARLDAGARIKKRGCYNPVLQQFDDPRQEEATITHMDEVMCEVRRVNEATQPPTVKGRSTTCYNMVSNEVIDPRRLQQLQDAENARTLRYKARFGLERNNRLDEVKFDDQEQEQRLERIGPQRFEEIVRRGYDVISNRVFGDGPNQQKFYTPRTASKTTSNVWDAIRAGVDNGDGGGAASASSLQRRSSQRSSSAGCSVGAARAGGQQQLSARGTLARDSFETPRERPPAPPAPQLPGTPAGSVFSRPRA